MPLKSLTIQEDLEALHRRVDRLAQQLMALHGARLTCHRGCAGCCVDDLTVFDVEAMRIRMGHPELLTRGSPAPTGRCAFLDGSGACRIYADRPYVCRTQGLPLRWLDEAPGPEGEEVLAEYRDICELNLPGPALSALPEAACWPIGPFEEALRRLQQQATPTTPQRRVSLRELFAD